MSIKYKVAGIFSPVDTDQSDIAHLVELLRDHYKFETIETKKGPQIVLKAVDTVTVDVEDSQDGVFSGSSRQVNSSPIVAFINVTKAFTIAKVNKSLAKHRWDISDIPDENGEPHKVVRLLLPTK
jgi:hypothetical protein